ncbi:MAG: MFS transporter [Steroidobacteraceae bacterium]|jgi:AAA family ATP:ADP antiporter|nr:MFS transporter [Steroidobacteraceae bacterium]
MSAPTLRAAAPAAAPTPRLRWLVAAGEGRALLAAAGAYFALLAGYYMLRSLREAFALEVGREHIGTLFYVTFAVMLAVLPLYWFVVARLPRRRLFPAVYATVIALFLGIASGMAVSPGNRALAAVYFVAVTSLNLFMVSVFWSVMADAWRSEAARRLFGFIAAGGSAGAIAGPLFNSLFVQRLGTTWVIVLACALLATAILAGRRAQDAGEPPSGGTRAGDTRLDVAVGGRAIDDLKRLVTSPYLLAIAALIVLGQVLGGFMYQEQAKYVEQAHATLGERAALFARVDLAVNLLALLFQGAVVGWLAARGGLKLALAFVPMLLIASLVLLALLPVGAVLIGTQVFRRAVDYGLFKPTREMLFTVLNPESKFKSKSLIDTLLQRGGDSAGQLAYPLVAGLGLAGVAWACAGVSLLMLAGATWLGGAFGRREAEAGR